MTSNHQVPNTDENLERAMAGEAVYAYERYLSFGVAPADYFSGEIQAIVKAADTAWASDGAVSLSTVAKALQRAGKLDAIGGVNGLAQALTTTAIPDSERFMELRRLRRIRESAQQIILRAENGDLAGAIDALGTAQTEAMEAADAGDVVDVFDLGCELLDKLLEGKHATDLVHPGLEIMQLAMGDLPLPSMTILGGGTNVGKSSVALEMLLCAAERNVVSGYVSCEDPRLLMSSRVLSVYTGMSSRQLVQGVKDKDQFHRLSAGFEPLKKVKGKVKLAFPVGGSEIDVCAAMSRMAQQGAKLIVVDYVQCIESSKKQQDRRNEIRWLCARIKAHAFRLNVALVLLSQLGRPPKGEEFAEPNKHSLREAGDLENAAEYVVLLWREGNDDFAPVNVKLEKSKFGNLGARWTMTRNEKTGRLTEDADSYRSAHARRAAGEQ